MAVVLTWYFTKKSFSDHYLNDMRHLKRPRILFTITSIPSRLGKLTSLLRLLRRQTVLREDDAIVVNLPKHSVREDCPYILPDDLERLLAEKPFILNRVEDQGPLTKLMGTLVLAQPDDIIIPLDDDTYFPPEYFEELVWHSLKHEDTVFGYHGLEIRNGSYRFVQEHEGPVDVVETVTGAVYRKKFFSDSFGPEDGPCRLTDDIVIAAEMARNGVKRRVLKSARDAETMRGRRDHMFYQDTEAENPLWKDNLGEIRHEWIKNNGNNTKCIDAHKGDW